MRVAECHEATERFVWRCRPFRSRRPPSDMRHGQGQTTYGNALAELCTSGAPVSPEPASESDCLIKRGKLQAESPDRLFIIPKQILKFSKKSKNLRSLKFSKKSKN